MSTFAGDKKTDRSWLIRTEERVVAATIDYVPGWLQTYHLTLMTVAWSIGVLVAGRLAIGNIQWLWLSSACIFLQYVTDLYDGKVGKHRDTGLIKWGYYMDHFLDYIFVGCVMVSYITIAPPELHVTLSLILLFCGGFMVNAFLAFAATNEFHIEVAGIGPTQVRFGLIVLNSLLIWLGTEWMPLFVMFALPASLLGLYAVVLKTQKRLWQIDMDAKNKK